LGEQPQRLARAQAEVDRALSGRPPSAADLRQLPYVDAVFSESMRLYPPAWMIGRETLQPISLGDIEVPAGVSILLPQWAVHRSPRWWPRPLDFEPERWLEAAPERPRFAFFPFGGGPRVCVGNHFARMEAVLVLACWLQAMDLQAERPPPTLLPSVTLRPRQGIGLIVRRRAS
jgi:cytochrome P450